MYDGPSHVVILGAGASIASTLRNPDPSGKALPSMLNFVDVVGLGDLLDPEENFESAYSRLHTQDPTSSTVLEAERRVADYFSGMTLPETPTLYDYLMLALRPKDLVATFNWDPFLYQAFCRNSKAGGMPHLSFLHGSVAIGYSERAHKAGPAGWYVDRACTDEYVPSRLLYPVAQKNYNSDEFIAHEWARLQGWLERSRRVTVFGYSAPETDVEAVDLMSGGWGDPTDRNLEQFEIVDVQPEEAVTARWRRFIHTHHYDYCTDYFESSLGQFPRRTGERFMHQFLPTTPEEAVQEPNPVPRDFATLHDLWDWHRPLIERENIRDGSE
ncbi:MAG: hypothetical protein IBX63_09745 [Coriobacteriia bacterium]|nr:hypothetical protein [Coriobacteriia bacterium]